MKKIHAVFAALPTECDVCTLDAVDVLDSHRPAIALERLAHSEWQTGVSRDIIEPRTQHFIAH